MLFQPVTRRENISIRIALELHRAIVNGALKQGEPLPGQRQLAAEFGTSMTTIREAISILSAAGVIDVSPGRGTVICGLSDSEPAFDGWLGLAVTREELLDLLETRAVVEKYLVNKAALHATPRQVHVLRQRLKFLREHIDDLEVYYSADIEFHQAIAELFGNRVIARLMKAIQVSMIRQLRHTHASAMAHRDRIVATYETHERMVDAIAANDAEGAVASLEQMIERARALFQEQIDSGVE